MMDKYTMGFQIRPTLVLDDYSPLLAPLMTEESTLKAVSKPPKPTADKASDSETLVSQVTPLWGTIPKWGASQHWPSGPAEDLGSHAGEILVAHDG